MSLLKRFAPALLAATLLTGATAASHADEQYFPLQSYRVGP
jgi:branched-chain amino acid transport system substrate-binding protein